MKVLEINEQPDGSAIVEVEMSEAEKDMFIEIGILTAIKEGMKEHVKSYESDL